MNISERLKSNHVNSCFTWHWRILSLLWTLLKWPYSLISTFILDPMLASHIFCFPYLILLPNEFIISEMGMYTPITKLTVSWIQISFIFAENTLTNHLLIYSLGFDFDVLKSTHSTAGSNGNLLRTFSFIIEVCLIHFIHIRYKTLNDSHFVVFSLRNDLWIILYYWFHLEIIT